MAPASARALSSSRSVVVEAVGISCATAFPEAVDLRLPHGAGITPRLPASILSRLAGQPGTVGARRKERLHVTSIGSDIEQALVLDREHWEDGPPHEQF